LRAYHARGASTIAAHALIAVPVHLVGQVRVERVDQQQRVIVIERRAQHVQVARQQQVRLALASPWSR
jgi:hypothetical protein